MVKVIEQVIGPDTGMVVVYPNVPNDTHFGAIETWMRDHPDDKASIEVRPKNYKHDASLTVNVEGCWNVEKAKEFYRCLGLVFEMLEGKAVNFQERKPDSGDG